MSSPEKLYLRLLSESDTVNSFSLGSKEYTPLKTFLRKQAKDFHSKNIAKTYVFADGKRTGRVWAYMTLGLIIWISIVSTFVSFII